MQKQTTSLPGPLLLTPKVFGDHRGFFLESYNQRALAELGLSETFVQDNQSYSVRNTLRGLHYQIQHPQGKLVRVVQGEILDVIVDLRRSSPAFGKSESFLLTSENKKIIWIPIGFAHGFVVLSETAHVLYKTTDYYHPEDERTLLWNDPVLGIDWKFEGEPILSRKDRNGVKLAETETFA